MLRRSRRAAWAKAPALPRPSSVPTVTGELLPVSVIVTAHNFGKYLPECLASVLQQTGVKFEVVLVDDASTDNTPDIAWSYRAWHVRYHRIEARAVGITRRTGLDATTFPLVLFLDGDNALPPGYLAAASRIMTADTNVGLVGCDLQFFGNSSRLWKLSDTFEPDSFRRRNCLDCGSVVRRQAIVQAQAPVNFPNNVASDWIMWRAVLDTFPWEVRWNPIPLLYRQHDTNMLTGRMERLAKSTRPHYEDAGLGLLPVTIFTTYSARVAKYPELWQRRLDWLGQQTWPAAQTRLVVANTSHRPLLQEVPNLYALGLAGVSIYDHFVGRPGLEDEYRRNEVVEAEVQVACAAIYNRMLREVATDWVLTLEDDVFPERFDLIEALMSAVDGQTYAVSGCYRQRYTAAWSTCDRDKVLAMPHLHQQRGAGVQVVGLASFGCLLLSTAQVAGTVFVGNEPPSKYYDVAWYARMLRDKPDLVCKVDWDSYCDHVGSQ